MRLHRTSHSLIWLIILSAGVVLGGGWISAYNFHRVTKLEQAVLRNANVITELDMLLSSVKDAESGLRGFLLTGDKAYLEPYEAGLRDAQYHFGLLDAIVRPRKMELQDLGTLLDNRLKLLADRLRAREQSQRSKNWAFEDGRRETEDLRSRVSSLKDDEQRHLALSETEAAQGERDFRYSILSTTLFTTLVLLAAFRRISRMQRQERAEARAIDVAKNRFLANMSHEIRTPLAAVLGYSDVLCRDKIAPQEREQCVSALQRNGQQLLKIIDDILDLSKVEAQKLEFTAVEFDLREVIEEVRAMLQLKAESKGIELAFAIDPAVSGTFRADPVRVKQVLINIIGNAIKFTSRGKVVVHGSVQDDDVVCFLVEDSGVGVGEDKSDQLFEPFTQGDSTTQRIFGGTGLGLSIARQIAQVMGGNVRLISSKIGHGSVFEITLRLERLTVAPQVVVSRAPAGESLTPSWSDKTILVVDDSEDNRFLVEYYLKATGARVLQAASGEEALRLIRRSQPDLILMDIQMPTKDGYQTTREIRELGVRKPIVAFTAHAMREEVERCQRSGCDKVLTKPISREGLVGGLSTFF